MGVIENLRAAVEIAQKVDNIDLYRQLLASQQDAMELMQKNADQAKRIHDLEGQKASLEEAIRLQAALVFRDGAYWRRDQPDGPPYCHGCWGDGRKLVPLVIYDDMYRCMRCKEGWLRPSRASERNAAIQREDDFEPRLW